MTDSLRLRETVTATGDPLRITDALAFDRESCEEHIRHVETMLDLFPLDASQGEQTIYLLNVKRRAELARTQLRAGNFFPKLNLCAPEPAVIVEEDGA